MHKIGSSYMKAIRPVTPVWLFLEMPGWDCCLGKWEFYGTVFQVNYLKTIRFSQACEGEEGKRSPLGRAPDTLLLPSTCPTGQSWVLLCGSFQVSCNGTCLSFTGTNSAAFRNLRRAESYQQLSNLARPPTAKQCVFCWNGGSLVAAENPKVFPLTM